MIVQAQDKKTILLIENIANISICDNVIMAMYQDGSDLELGVYDSTERCKSVLNEIMMKYSHQCVFGGRMAKYEMPEQ